MNQSNKNQSILDLRSGREPLFTSLRKLWIDGLSADNPRNWGGQQTLQPNLFLFEVESAHKRFREPALALPPSAKPLIDALPRHFDRCAADLADAPGRKVSAGIQGTEKPGKFLPRVLLHAGTGCRSQLAAAASLPARRGDRVLRHPGRSRCARPEGLVRGRQGAQAGTPVDRRGYRGASATRSFLPARTGLRRCRGGARRPSGPCRADRFRRSAVDDCHLHDRGRDEPRSRADSGAGLRCARLAGPADLHPDVGRDRAPDRPGPGRRRNRPALRQLGGRSCRRRTGSGTRCVRWRKSRRTCALPVPRFR